MMIPKKSFHFSVDDVFDSLIEVSDSKIFLFEHPFFNFLKEINEKFDVKVGLYLFYQKTINGKIRTLKEIVNIRNEIEKNPWLFFGPHALEYSIPPYVQSDDEQVNTFEKIYREIDRFAGQRSYTKYVRLHYYSESYELADYFKEKGVIGLFTTDREMGSHRMPRSVGRELLDKGLAKYKEMNFIRTQLRAEFFSRDNLSSKQIREKIREVSKRYSFVIVYTHEIDMRSVKGKQMINIILKATRDLNLSSITVP